MDVRLELTSVRIAMKLGPEAGKIDASISSVQFTRAGTPATTFLALLNERAPPIELHLRLAP